MSNNKLKDHKVPFLKGTGKPFKAEKIGRNELCKCGSGKKSKRCCGSETEYRVKK